jgi:hypothetical protein
LEALLGTLDFSAWLGLRLGVLSFKDFGVGDLKLLGVYEKKTVLFGSFLQV